VRGIVPVSPLSLNQLTRDYWSQFDAAIIAQLAELYYDPCYRLKIYKAPSDDQEVVAGFDYVTYGLRIVPGSLIFGFYSPLTPNFDDPAASNPANYTVHITDVSMEHQFSDEPFAALFYSNFKPVFQSSFNLNMGSAPNLLVAPYPVVGSGQFDIRFQSTISDPQRIQLVIGCFEACDNEE
jgi:hypothetical protein